MTLSQIKELYIVNGWNDKYLIYERNAGVRFVHKYLCTVVKKNRRFAVEGFDFTSNIDDLKSQINQKVQQYLYDSDYYNPCMRNRATVRHFIHDRLGELGFKPSGGFSDFNCYVYAEQTGYGYTPYTVHLSVNIDENKETVKVMVSTGEWSWVDVKCGFDFKEIENAIHSLLKPLFLHSTFNTIRVVEKMTIGEVAELVKTEFSPSNLTTKTTNMKQTLKTQLQELIDKL